MATLNAAGQPATPATSATEMSPAGEVFEAYFKTAWAHFKKGEFKEANEMAKWLLLQPTLGRYHKAGTHLILAHSPDCYVEHAREAVRHFKDLYTETDAQAQSKKNCVAFAEKVLEKAEKDAKELAEIPLTDEEYDQHFREFQDNLDERDERIERERSSNEGESGEGEGESGEDKRSKGSDGDSEEMGTAKGSGSSSEAAEKSPQGGKLRSQRATTSFATTVGRSFKPEEESEKEESEKAEE